jgi:hypothetical protein
MSALPPELPARADAVPPAPRVDLLPEPASTSYAAPAAAPGRPRLNALAVAALILAILFSPLAALFGHIAVGQISRSRGGERGLVIAWVSVGLGYLWLLGAVVIGIVAWQVLAG